MLQLLYTSAICCLKDLVVSVFELQEFHIQREHPHPRVHSSKGVSFWMRGVDPSEHPIRQEPISSDFFVKKGSKVK